MLEPWRSSKATGISSSAARMGAAASCGEQLGRGEHELGGGSSGTVEGALRGGGQQLDGQRAWTRLGAAGGDKAVEGWTELGL